MRVRATDQLTNERVRVTTQLTDEEYRRLTELALSERRTPREQASYLLAKALAIQAHEEVTQ